LSSSNIATRESHEPLERNPNPHDFALLCMVFAVGALVDLDQHQFGSVRDQCERYYTLAKTAVCLKSPLVGGNIALVEVLNFMINYS
jgi:hypothetical protein